MYAQFFGLKQDPFAIAPDPRYLFLSERHREALAHLLYGLDAGGGFVLLSGEIGTGKTTVCRHFLEQMPAHCQVAYIFNPKLTVLELLHTVCDEFGLAVRPGGPGPATVKDYIDPLNAFLLAAHAQGRNSVLIIDEAQNLSAEVLEQLRLLTNLETNERKLLQIILVGQPELRDMLAQPEMEQLAQRVVARFHLGPLSEAETVHYMAHRLLVAGMTGPLPFGRAATRRIHQLTRGVPRRINLLCDRALLGAYAQGLSVVDRKLVDAAAQEVFFQPGRPASGSPLAAWLRQPRHAALTWLGLGLLGGAALFGAASLATQSRGPAPVAPAAARLATAPAMGLAASAPAPAMAPAVAASASPQAATADLATLTRLRDETQAWRELALLWGLPASAETPCQAAPRLAQTHCFKGTTSLALIRQLDRPGLLTLYDDKRQPFYVLLTGLTADSALLQADGSAFSLPLATLANAWRGEFASWWRAPAGWSKSPTEGSTGSTVDWLAAQLARFNSQPPPAAAQTFDATLRARLQAFQLAQGLQPDGRPGPMTLMQLNRVAGVAEPRLHNNTPGSPPATALAHVLHP
jgi:general secretion pathway protein A